MGTLECRVTSGESYHPTIHISIPAEELRAHIDSGCSAKAYLTLPPVAFVDPYELANYEEFYDFQHWGPSNLELPTMAMPAENSTVLLDIHIPKDSDKVDLQLPIHLRYEALEKRSSSGYHGALIDCPTGFIVCPNSGSSSSRSREDAPRVPTEVSALFDGGTMTLLPMKTRVGTNANVSIRVPVGNPLDVAYVEGGTAVVIIVCFLYLLRAFLSAAKKLTPAGERVKKE